MRNIIVRYGVGYGSHDQVLEVEDDATSKDIEESASELVMAQLEWDWVESRGKGLEYARPRAAGAR